MCMFTWLENLPEYRKDTGSLGVNVHEWPHRPGGGLQLLCVKHKLSCRLGRSKDSHSMSFFCPNNNTSTNWDSLTLLRDLLTQLWFVCFLLFSVTFVIHLKKPEDCHFNTEGLQVKLMK